MTHQNSSLDNLFSNMHITHSIIGLIDDDQNTTKNTIKDTKLDMEMEMKLKIEMEMKIEMGMGRTIGSDISGSLTNITYMRDFVDILIDKHNINNGAGYVKYIVYAVNFNGTTKVLSLTRTQYADLYKIELNVSRLDPTTIINDIYKFNNNKKRSIYLTKKAQKTKNFDSVPTPLLSIDPLLDELFHVVYNDRSISATPKTTITEVVNAMMF